MKLSKSGYIFVVHPVYTRETPALGGISLALQKIGSPWAPHIWGAGGAPVGTSAYAAFGDEKKKKFGAP